MGKMQLTNEPINIQSSYSRRYAVFHVTLFKLFISLSIGVRKASKTFEH